MGDVPPAAKRSRIDTDSDAAADALTPKQHDVLWFNDGSIILEVENTRFRVHRDLLALHSPVFRDMATLPQGTEGGQDTYDGCPVVRLYDSLGDVENMLFALYHRRPYSLQDPPPMSFVLSLLRIGTKYMIDVLRGEATRILRRHFPGPGAKFRRQPFLEEDTVAYLGRDARWVLIDVLNVAETTGLLDVIPAVCYCLSSLSSQAILRGVDRSNGTLSRPSPSNQERLLIGTEKLVAALNEMLFPAALQGTPQCDIWANYQCRAARFSILADSVKRAKDIDVFQPWDQLFGNNEEGLGEGEEGNLCNGCQTEGKRGLHEAQDEVWDQLPSFFGLPCWEELGRTVES